MIISARFIVHASSLLHPSFARIEDEDGQTLAEYGLIMAVITVAVVLIVLMAFRGAIVESFYDATDCLDGTC